MQHLTIKAASTATDQGRFSAIAAAWSVDREGDQIRRGAFAATIREWQQSGKRLPLHWNHGGSASDVIGWVDPASMREADEGLYVKGQLDLEDSATAKEAWRSMKNNAVSLSFGYLVTKSEDRADGIRELQAIDLFEVSIVPHPANADTRFVELKSATSREADPFAKLFASDVFRLPGPKTQEQIDAEILVIAEKAEAAEKKAARPIKIATFEC
jgi:Escherichia/Staphylococcus phage prohead protease